MPQQRPDGSGAGAEWRRCSAAQQELFCMPKVQEDLQRLLPLRAGSSPRKPADLFIVDLQGCEQKLPTCLQHGASPLQEPIL